MFVSERRPEHNEVFDETEAKQYASGCDVKNTSDYRINAIETTRPFNNSGRIRGTHVVVCFGPGNELEEFARLGANPAIGVDASPTMIAHAQKRFPREIAEGKIILKKGWAQALPLDSGIADGTSNFNSFHQFKDEARALAALSEQVRILKPGGWGFIRDFRRNVPAWRMDEFLRKRRSNVPELLRESLSAAFTEDEFRDMLAKVDGIKSTVRKARDPRRILALWLPIAKDPIPHWLDHMISQDVMFQKIK